jgi:predicted PurR-regulated permease PerM
MSQPESHRSFAARVLLATVLISAVVGGAYLIARYAHLLLLIFAAILIAVLVDALAGYLARHTPVSRGWAVLAVWAALLMLLAALVFFGGPRIADQMAALSDRVGEATTSIRQYLDARAWGEWLLREASEFGTSLPAGSDLVGRITRFFSTAVSWIVGAVVIAVLAMYLSASPDVYVDNLLRLVPEGRRERMREVFRTLGRSLRWWLLGRLTAMAMLGLLTTIGLAITGVPLAITLGVLATVTAFVPYLGPVLWLIPAALVAWASDPLKVVWVAAIYGVAQFLEGNLITPLIQQRAVSIPPALLLALQLVMGVFFGALGVLVATPLGVAVIIVVQMLYIEDMLGEEVRLLGSHGASGD